MKKAITTGALVLAGLSGTVLLTNNSSNTKIPKYNDRDCENFSSKREAQNFFEDQGGPNNDYHNLDRDGDGIACESI